MVFFEYESYKRLVRERVEAMPRAGRGEWARIAGKLGVNSSMVSQIFRGDKHLSPEQALALADFLAFSDTEKEYFLTLVHRERAGTAALRRYFDRRLKHLRATAEKITERLRPSQSIAKGDQATFYSSWHYSAIRQLLFVPGCASVDRLSEALGISRQRVREALDFLVSGGLSEEREGKFRPTLARTHLPADSPLIARHHANWRLKAIECLEEPGPEDLAYTCPMTLSHADAATVKRRLAQCIGEIDTIVDPSPSQRLACLNIDFVRIS